MVGEPSKKRNLVLKDKTGKVIVPKDLLEPQGVGFDCSQTSALDNTLNIHDPDKVASLANTSSDHCTISDDCVSSGEDLLHRQPSNELLSSSPSPEIISEEVTDKQISPFTSQVDEVCDLLPPPASGIISEVIDDAGSEDDWEAQASKLSEDTTDISTVSQPLRSLRPGGGEPISYQNAVGPSTVIVYSKSDILTLRVGLGNLQRPPQCMSYEKLIFLGQDNQPIPRNLVRPQHSMSPKLQGHSEKWKQQNPTYSPSQTIQVPPNEPSQYKRNAPSRGSKKVPPPPMPKKLISNPLELMTREVMALLNKITPQTFLKLTGKLSEIQIQNSSMMEKFVRLVFEKAISEPNFANLYAEMCSILDSSNNYTNFCHIVWNRDTNQYLWLKDIQYSNILAGPYHSVSDCIEACLSRVAPPTQLITHPVTVAEEVIVNNNLISVNFD